jgi:hypothetical protein
MEGSRCVNYTTRLPFSLKQSTIQILAVGLGICFVKLLHHQLHHLRWLQTLDQASLRLIERLVGKILLVLVKGRFIMPRCHDVSGLFGILVLGTGMEQNLPFGITPVESRAVLFMQRVGASFKGTIRGKRLVLLLMPYRSR